MCYHRNMSYSKTPFLLRLILTETKDFFFKRFFNVRMCFII